MAAFALCVFLSLGSVHAFLAQGLVHRPNFGAVPQPIYSTISRTVVTEEIQFQPKFRPTWEQHVADEIRASLHMAQDDSPYMVAVVGIPGSGKTTSAEILGDLLEEQGVSTMVMPFDGYHYSIETLKTFPNPDDVIYRRGAPDTFDAKALHRDLLGIRHGKDPVIKVPGFDHAEGDPKKDVHTFDRTRHRVLICEGLYLLHDQDGWEEIASSFHRSIFVNADVDLCVERLKIRNKCIPGYTPEEIEFRCDQVDRRNALTVASSMWRADTIVESSANPRANEDECEL